MARRGGGSTLTLVRSLNFYKLKLLYLLRQATKFRSFYFCKCKSCFIVATFIKLIMIVN